MKDFIVYTAISRGYDTLMPPPTLWRDEADFVAFLETASPTPGWAIQPLHHGFSDPCRNAKIHKILAHHYFPRARYSLWVDGSVLIHSALPLREWIAQYLDGHDLAVFAHRCRHCIYAEAKHCIACGVDSPEVIQRQVLRYRDEGYPENNGLAECTVLLRRHTRQIELLNETWHEEICRHSRRDQLSFNYVAHQLGVRFAHLPGNMADNPHFQWLPHASSTRKTWQETPCLR